MFRILYVSLVFLLQMPSKSHQPDHFYAEFSLFDVRLAYCTSWVYDKKTRVHSFLGQSFREGQSS